MERILEKIEILISAYRILNADFVNGDERASDFAEQIIEMIIHQILKIAGSHKNRHIKKDLEDLCDTFRDDWDVDAIIDEVKFAVEHVELFSR